MPVEMVEVEEDVEVVRSLPGRGKKGGGGEARNGRGAQQTQERS